MNRAGPTQQCIYVGTITHACEKIEEIGKITLTKVLAALGQRRQSVENCRLSVSWLSYYDRRRGRATGDQGERTTGGHSNSGGCGGVSTQGFIYLLVDYPRRTDSVRR